jgi:hypothetical protein
MCAPDILSGAEKGDWLDNFIVMHLLDDEAILSLNDEGYRNLKALLVRELAKSQQVHHLLHEITPKVLETVRR